MDDSWKPIVEFDFNVLCGNSRFERDQTRQQREQRVFEPDGSWNGPGSFGIFIVWEDRAIIVRAVHMGIGHVGPMPGSAGKREQQTYCHECRSSAGECELGSL